MGTWMVRQVEITETGSGWKVFCHVYGDLGTYPILSLCFERVPERPYGALDIKVKCITAKGHQIAKKYFDK